MSRPAGVNVLTLGFLAESTVGETMQHVCQAGTDTVKPAMAAAVGVHLAGRAGTFAGSRADIADIDRAQYVNGDGPGVTAFATGHPVFVAATTDEAAAFPVFRAAALAGGVRSVLSVPMTARTTPVGVLNLYSDAEDAFTTKHLTAAAALAAQAAFLFVNTQAYWDAVTRGENLSEAITSRAPIEQAKGIIMGAIGCSADEAFDRLRIESQRKNVKLRHLAADVVRRSRRRRS